MTKFNPSSKTVLTYEECLVPAMTITDPEDAKQYLKEYIKYTQRFLDEDSRSDGKTAEQITRENLGYYAGYYDHETRDRVERLFQCEHPIFGSIEKNGAPTPEEAFEAGLKAGSHE